MNNGVKPDGTRDFPELPPAFATKDYREHHAFWKQHQVPDSWVKFRDIALYWIGKGVDGFRFDMAEMVPVEFWSYMNSAIKMANPEAFLLAEIYNPRAYRDYIILGQMGYLYDKVDLYDTLKPIMQGTGSTDDLVPILQRFADIEHHLLHFLENHDEQRLAHPEFAGSAEKGKPAMVVSATIGSSPIMIYFGQEVGEDGSEKTGFGDPSRTTIFDYAGVPAHQRWMNGGRFDGGQSTAAEKALREFYRRLLSFAAQSQAVRGGFAEIHSVNRSANAGYHDKLFSYVRHSDEEKLVIVANFSTERSGDLGLIIPAATVAQMGLTDGEHVLVDQLYEQARTKLVITGGTGRLKVSLNGLESVILKVDTPRPPNK